MVYYFFTPSPKILISSIFRNYQIKEVRYQNWKKLKFIISKSLTRGFTIMDISCDNEFNGESSLSIFVHVENMYVLIIKQSIRTIKERSRAASIGLPYEFCPKFMTISLLEGVEYWLNSIPTERGAPTEFIPTIIVADRLLPKTTQKRISFGAYAMVYTGTSNTTMDSRTILVIGLRESNMNVGFYFMSQESGKRI